VTNATSETDLPAYGDALSAPFWEAAARGELLIQRCADCGHSQFYPRPFCLACQSDNVAWTQAAGTGAVYSQTTVHIQVLPELPPPYTVAIVELDEGPRLTANIVNGETRIGERVRVAWRQRDGLPPLPVFEPADS
jgi:uncharacterized protein